MAAVPGAAFALGQLPMSGFDVALNTFNTSPYIIGSMMLMMNLGARFLSLEVTKGQEAFLSHPWIRRFLIFVVFFIGTRNVWVAFWMALIVILLIGYLFNENSSLCLFKGGLPGAACSMGDAKAGSQLKEGFHAEDGDTTHMAAEGGDHGSKPLIAQQAALTPEEQDILQKLLAKQQKFQQSVTSAATVPAEPPKLYDIYRSNLDKVKNLF
jgi:hypothetical protein